MGLGLPKQCDTGNATSTCFELLAAVNELMSAMPPARGLRPHGMRRDVPKAPSLILEQVSIISAGPAYTKAGAALLPYFIREHRNQDKRLKWLGN